MQRIVIMGGPGSGKSTLARRLGDKLGLKVVHLDALNFDPGWVEADTPTFQARLTEAIAGDRWVSDGNYTSKTGALRLARADTVIWLHQPRWKRMWRVLVRSLAHRGRTRPDMARGCPERLDRAFLLYAWRWDRDKRGSTLQRLRETAAHLPITILRGDREIEAFIDSQEPKSYSAQGTSSGGPARRASNSARRRS